tara:strand:- start:143 stop:370 length:228 start_codon:yes stop_codon:yes gene_type:complete
MKTITFHKSNLGKFEPHRIADDGGYITIHDSARYGSASEGELNAWDESRFSLIRNAAMVEMACRKLSACREELKP